VVVVDGRCHEALFSDVISEREYAINVV
jgi:hypothetical protein